jgi:hypothetical protein
MASSGKQQRSSGSSSLVAAAVVGAAAVAAAVVGAAAVALVAAAAPLPCPCTPRTVSLIARANTKYQNRPPFSRRNISTTIALIDNAIAAIEQEELGEQLVY